MKNRIELVIGVEMKYYHQKMPRKSLDYGRISIKLDDSLLLNLESLHLFE
jgi:hypothetical protein